MSRIAASTIAPTPRAIAHPRDDILPETFPVMVLDMASSPCCSYVGMYEGLVEPSTVTRRAWRCRRTGPLRIDRGYRWAYPLPTTRLCSRNDPTCRSEPADR